MHFSTSLGAYVFTVVCVVVSTLVPNAASNQRIGEAPERVCFYSHHPRPVYGGICGSAIPDAVSAACNQNRSQRKRSADMIGPISKASVGLEKRDAMKFLAKRDAFSNILCECCYNYCTSDELQEYC